MFDSIALTAERLAGNSNLDIVYNTTTSLWHCCGTASDGAPACNRPTEETFQAPAPEDLPVFDVSSMTSLSAVPGASPSGSTSTVSSTPASSRASPQSSPSVSSVRSSGLGEGAKAGISIGVILGVGCMLLLAVILYRIVRKQHQHETAGLEVPSEGHPNMEQYPPELTGQRRVPELRVRGLDHELDFNRTFLELPNTDNDV